MLHEVLGLLQGQKDVLGSYERAFNGDATVRQMQAHTEVPIFLAFSYVAFVFWGQQFMEKRPPLNLKPLVAAWNLFLSTYSLMGAVIIVPYTIKTLYQRGFHWMICTSASDREYLFDTREGFWVYIFILSKIPEMIDTVFLVLQKKKVIFLHWFHHTTVMLYCWHSWVTSTPTGMFFAAMNYFIHSIMYTYYFFMCFSWGRKLVRRFAPLITLSQIVQMVFGLSITMAAFVKQLDGRHGCPGTDPANVRLALGMYLAYLLLFAHLFYGLYLSPKAKPATASAGSSPTDQGKKKK